MAEYSEDYINTCFTVWYSAGQPTNMNLVIEKMPSSVDGNVPSKATLARFRSEYGWDERADALNTQAIEKVEHELVDNKAILLRQQMEDALAINAKAKEHILESGFDSSSSAVQAFFKSSEEARLVIGISQMLTKVSKMSDEDALARVNKLLKKKDLIEGQIMEENDNSEASVT